VRHLIFIGHVHTFSQYERIIAQGSFDRLSHGQEEPKGHVRAVVYQNGEREVTFVENTGAKKFITIDCTQDLLEETIEEIHRVVSELKPDSHVRLRLNQNHPLLASTDTLIRRWPLIHWSKDVKETGQEGDIAEAEPDAGEEYIPITIMRENIVEMVMNRVLLHPDITDELLVLAQEQLERVI
jgi:DNA repair exonuclease SbcCD nuclease subunit